MDVTTSDNYKLAQEIDAVETLKDPDLLKRRAEVTFQAMGTSDEAEQTRLLRTLHVIEFVAGRRASLRPRPTGATTSTAAAIPRSGG